jgi:hypothetical protein
MPLLLARCCDWFLSYEQMTSCTAEVNTDFFLVFEHTYVSP